MGKYDSINIWNDLLTPDINNQNIIMKVTLNLIEVEIEST